MILISIIFTIISSTTLNLALAVNPFLKEGKEVTPADTAAGAVVTAPNPLDDIPFISEIEEIDEATLPPRSPCSPASASHHHLFNICGETLNIPNIQTKDTALNFGEISVCRTSNKLVIWRTGPLAEGASKYAHQAFVINCPVDSPCPAKEAFVCAREQCQCNQIILTPRSLSESHNPIDDEARTYEKLEKKLGGSYIPTKKVCGGLLMPKYQILTQEYSKSLNVVQKLQLQIAISDALAKLHEMGIALADLKPDNIGIEIIDGNFVIHFIDVSDWRFDDTPSSSPPNLTPRYTPPVPDRDVWSHSNEQKDDVYRLAISILEMRYPETIPDTLKHNTQIGTFTFHSSKKKHAALIDFISTKLKDPDASKDPEKCTLAALQLALTEDRAKRPTARAVSRALTQCSLPKSAK